MNKKEEVLLQIEQIFRTELNDPNLKVTSDSSSDTIEQWNSINNLLIIDAIEKNFKLLIPIDVIFSMNNVGDIVNYLADNAHPAL